MSEPEPFVNNIDIDEAQMNIYRALYSPGDWRKQVLRKSARRAIEWGLMGVAVNNLVPELWQKDLTDSIVVGAAALVTSVMVMCQGNEEGIGPGLIDSIREYRRAS